MNQTELIGQMIDLRARGWTYEKIARHTGIARKLLARWARQYRGDIVEQRTAHRDILAETRRLRAACQVAPGAPQLPARKRESCPPGPIEIANRKS